MPGPRNADEALTWIQEAVRAGRYVPSVHFYDRMAERRIDILDVFHAIDAATAGVEYVRGGGPRNGGTCWRVTGTDLDETQEVAVGVEAFLDKKRRRCVFCTVFKLGE